MIKQKLFGLVVIIIYLYASYQFKVVNYNGISYYDSGISDNQVILGGLLIMCYMFREIYLNLKYTIILKNKMRKNQNSDN